MPRITSESSPQRVISRNLAGSRVSSEMLIRPRPAAASSAAVLSSSSAAFVVIVISLNLPVSESIATRLEIPRRTSGSPPVRRTLSIPISPALPAILTISSKLRISSCLLSDMPPSGMQ